MINPFLFGKHKPVVPPPQPVAIVRYEQNFDNLGHYSKDQIGNSRHRLNVYKQQLHLSAKQKEIGLGVMLGDASLQTQDNGKTFRLKFEGGNRNKEYIQHLHNEFDDWCLSDRTAKIRTHPKTGTQITNWSFQTLSHSDLKYFADLFLKDKKKLFLKG